MVPSPAQLELDRSRRARVLSHVEALSAARGRVLSWAEIDAGLEIDGRRVRIANRPRGIFRPQGAGFVGALSVKTSVPRRGRRAWYDDEIKSADGLFAYRYRGTNPQDSDNILVRTCFTLRLPLLYLLGVAPAQYMPFICKVVDDFPAQLTFMLAPVVAADVADSSVLKSAAIRPPMLDRRYAVRWATQRLHQSRFRERVLTAYGGGCTVCHLRHRGLLDAAHIIPDREEGGDPVVPNGLSLCKLHHAAYDQQMIGITPDYEVRVSPALLLERDGPVLEHGLKNMHRVRLRLPKDPDDLPDRNRLDRRWQAVAWRSA